MFLVLTSKNELHKIDLGEAPKFVIQLQDLTVQLGSAIELECKVYIYFFYFFCNVNSRSRNFTR